MPIQASNINNIQLYTRRDDARAMDLCRAHRRTITADIAPDFKDLVATQLFQDQFKEFIPANDTDEADINVRITDRTITVKNATHSKTIDLNALSDAQNAEDINEDILRKAQRIYQNCLAEEEDPTPRRRRIDPEEIDRVSRRAERVASQIENTPQLAAKLAQLENQLQRIETRLGTLSQQAPLPTPQARMDSILQRVEQVQNTTQSRPSLTAEPSLSQQDFTKLTELSNQLSVSALPTIDNAHLAKFNEVPAEARNAVFYQTYLLANSGSVPEHARWPLGEKLFTGQPGLPLTATNQDRSDAIRHFLLHNVGTDFASQPGPRPSQELFERFEMLSDQEKNAVYAQLQYLLHRTGPEDTPIHAQEAFFNQNGRTATNAQRSEAIHRALAALIVSHHRSQLEAYDTALRNLSLEKATLQTQLDSTVDTLRQTGEALHSAEQKFKQAITDKETLALRIVELERTGRQSQEQIRRLEHSKQDLETQLLNAQNALLQKEADLKQANLGKTNLFTQNEALSIQLNAALEQNTQLRSKITTLELQLEQTKNALQEANNSNAALSSQNSDLQNKLQTAEQQKAELLSKNSALESELQQTKKALSQSEQEKENLLDLANRQLQQLQEAQAQIESINQSNKDLTSTNSSLVDQVVQLEMALKQSKQQLDQLGFQLQQLQAEKETADEERLELNQTIDSQRQQINFLNETNGKLRTELAKNQTLQKELDTASETIDQLKESLSRLQSTIQQERQNADKIRTDFAKERDEMRAQQKSLEQRMQKLSSVLAEKEKQIEEYAHAAQDNFERVNEAEARSKQLKTEASEKNKEIERLRQDLSQLQAELEKIKEEEINAAMRSIERISPSEISSNNSNNSNELENANNDLFNLAEALQSIGGIDISIRDLLKKKVFGINRDLLRITEIAYKPEPKTLTAKFNDELAKTYQLGSPITLKANDKKILGNTLWRQLDELREAIAKSNVSQKIRTIDAHFKHLHAFCADFKKVSSQFIRKIDPFKVELAKLMSLHKNYKKEALLQMIRGETTVSSQIDLTEAKKAYAEIQTFCESQFLPLLDGMPARLLLTIEQLARLNENTVNTASTYPTKLKEDLSTFKTSFLTLLTMISIT